MGVYWVNPVHIASTKPYRITITQDRNENTRVTRALQDLNLVLRARGSGVELVSQGMR